MNLTIDQSLLDVNPHLKLGMIHYTKITVSESPQMLKGRVQLFQEQLYFELQEKPVTEQEGIKEWRQVWKQFGADPNRYRHSAEALMRRVAKQNYLQPFHSAVDLNNLFSMKYQIPAGIYDVHKIEGNVQLTVGDENTGYEGLNGRFNTLKGILTLQDEQGSFGSPFVDSSRTAVTEDTTEAMQVFFLRPSMQKDEANDLLNASGEMFTQIHGGDFRVMVISHK